MKKVIISLLTTLLLSLLFTCQIHAQGTNITVHYHRFDQNYTNWDVWLWQYLPTSQAGKAFPFTGTDEFGVYTTTSLADLTGYNATNPTTEIGFIVKKGNWVDRESGGDHLVSVSSGNQEVYLIEGDPTVYMSRSEADISPKIASALFTNFTTIQFTTTDLTPVTDFKNSVHVLQGTNELEILDASLQSDLMSGTIVLSAPIELQKAYSLTLPGYNQAKMIDKIGLYDTEDFQTEYVYEGSDLGATYTKDATQFRVWAPTANALSVLLYATGDSADTTILNTVPMILSDKGTWVANVPMDLKNVYYTYKVTIGNTINETVDPYALAVGVNGLRAMVVNLDDTNPTVWTNSKPKLNHPEDTIIYELHIRDLSSNANSGISNKGKFLGLTEKGTQYQGVSTGIDHLVDLGITHVHILPAFDFRSIDEKSTAPTFNWGYDPLNYNVPEGSYATDPYTGTVRITEFKEMVQTLHDSGIRVVMDVVYNHLGDATTSSFQKLVPNYFFRTNELGQFTNGSGVGNETASERPMMRKFMMDSVSYWAHEYHIDGFRFDLMAVHDIDTMNDIRATLTAIDPSIIIYGEGWTGGTSALPTALQATKDHVNQMPGIGVFNDVTRDGIKGSVWSDTDKGFVQGNGKISDVMFGIVGGITHPQTRAGWGTDPEQIINYVAAHDNYTLWDKLTLSQPSAPESLKISQDKQAAAIVLTSQGIPFLHAGQDFLRSKPYQNSYSGNSYNLPDYVNQLHWENKVKYIDVFHYYQGLIALRKAHPAFRMTNQEDIVANLTFIDTSTLQNVIAYTLDHSANGDSWEKIVVAFNGSSKSQTLNLGAKGTYNIVVNKTSAGTKVLKTVKGSTLKIDANESIVAYMGPQSVQDFLLLIILSFVVGFGLIGVIVFSVLKRRNPS